MAFERRFDCIQQLKSEPLFTEHLLPDIVKEFKAKGERYRDVFPAVRKDRIDFYHKGGKLFSYNSQAGFTTHHKYASVIKHNERNPYVTDSNLQAIGSFLEGYERIKENCALYSGLEALGVSRIYGDYSCAKCKRSHNVVVLDIEISLRRDGKDEESEPGISHRVNSDRIDLLLFNTKTGKLLFYEAKHFSNSEIRADSDHKPAIVEQMRRYEEQLNTMSVRKQILLSYEVHIGVINQLFDLETPLPEPRDVDAVPRLLVFGFDKAQLDNKLKKEINRLETEYDLRVYPIGDISGVDPDTLFNGGRKH